MPTSLPPARRFECVIFDLDGTLTDSSKAIVDSANLALVQFGFAAREPSAILALVGLPLDTVLSRLLPPHDQALLGAVVDHYRQVYPAQCRATTRLFPGTLALLDALAGRFLAVATGKNLAGALRVLGDQGLLDRFDLVVGHDSVAHPKPHPDMVHAVWRSCSAAPERTLVIGDTTYDLDMGRAAGATTCAVTWGNHDEALLRTRKPDFVVHSLAEIEALA